MSILEQIDDAKFLAEHRRYVGALTLALLAVAASAKKVFPQGTSSRINPKSKMGDREAFTMFLGSRLATILFDEFGDHQFVRSGIVFQGMQKDKELDLCEVLYVFYRNGLVHEAEFSSGVTFGSMPKEFIVSFGAEPDACIDLDGTLRLGYGWIDVLVIVVENAVCNAKEFGVEHYDLIPADNNISAIEQNEKLVQKYDASLKRVEVLKEIVRILSCEEVLKANREQLTHFLRGLLATKKIGYSSIIGLSSRGFTSHDGALTEAGVNLLHEIATVFKRVRVA
ncbi:hypothetical protein [Pseudomonas sp. Root562]|uniref:hypothetical protein n=1 Tax=Pseudomonas sp. Root562 TaxID=1736561 RepID=UPI000702B92E|nr:hypothetical protein [Pseudomonas sp. Root562]KQZ80632.1 hypothetical protein ASD60_14965 [Pseudomonas sp. Root562]